jgi:hypothetical protein
LDSMADLTGRSGMRHVGRRRGDGRSAIRTAASLGLALVAGALAVFPAVAGADELPNGYAYELVAPPFSYGQAVGIITIAPDGNSAVLTSPGALEDAGNAPDLGGAFNATRTDAGWVTTPMIPPASEFPTWSVTSANGVDASSDGREVLWWVQLREDKNTKRFTPVLTDADGNVEIAGPTVDDTAPGLGSEILAASANLRTIVIRSVRRNLATDGAPDTRSAARSGLYVSRPSPDAPGEFRVRQVAFRAGASMNAATCAVELGSARSARGAVSDDGRRIFFSFSGFSSCVSAANQRVWVRDGDDEPQDLAASLCTVDCGVAAPAYFEAASYDGQRVYFTTEQKLLDGDQDDTDRGDLYVHDSAFAANNRLRAVTASGTTGQGAGVQGVVRISDDGAYVYFVANGRPLAGENARGESPQPGDNNLYVYHRPRSPLSAPATFRFIGRLDGVDVNRDLQFSMLNAQNRPVVASSDGRYLFFLAYSDLTGEKQVGDTHRDSYRYDSVTDELMRIWTTDPEHNGAERADGIWAAGVGPKEKSFDGARQKERRAKWAISDDGGTIAFSTAEPLSPDDANTKRDVYMWREDTGQITMVTGGRSIRDLDAGGVSPGGDVFFLSDEALVPQHRSGFVTTFVARQGGGFPAPPELPTPCSGDGCQGPPDGQPSAMAIGSIDLTGGGNVPWLDDRVTAAVAVGSLKRVYGSVARLRVRVPAAGRISVSGASVRRISRSATRAATYTVRVPLGAKAKRRLKKRETLKVKVRVAFQAKAGRSAARTVTLTFKQPKSKRAGR